MSTHTTEGTLSYHSSIITPPKEIQDELKTKHSRMTRSPVPHRILERAVTRLPAGSTLAFVRGARALDGQETLRTSPAAKPWRVAQLNQRIRGTMRDLAPYGRERYSARLAIEEKLKDPL